MNLFGVESLRLMARGLNYQLAVAAVATVLISQASAHAANLKKGSQLAQSLCSQCHVVTSSGRGGWTNAPSFPAIADMPNTTAASLQSFIQKPHMNMLNLGRPPAEAADLAAYILSLKQK